jgi:hypothetical protein
LEAVAAEPKSLSRFLGVSDLVFFLSDLEDDDDAGDAADAEAGAEVGVRGLLLPSGLEEDSDDLCRDEKKRPLNTIAPPRPARRGGVSSNRQEKQKRSKRRRQKEESVRAGEPGLRKEVARTEEVTSD